MQFPLTTTTPAGDKIEVGEPRTVVIVPLFIKGQLYEVEAPSGFTNAGAARFVYAEAVRQMTAAHRKKVQSDS
jgi:hypothetical protein